MKPCIQLIKLLSCWWVVQEKHNDTIHQVHEHRHKLLNYLWSTLSSKFEYYDNFVSELKYTFWNTNLANCKLITASRSSTCTEQRATAPLILLAKLSGDSLLVQTQAWKSSSKRASLWSPTDGVSPSIIWLASSVEVALVSLLSSPSNNKVPRAFAYSIRSLAHALRYSKIVHQARQRNPSGILSFRAIPANPIHLLRASLYQNIEVMFVRNCIVLKLLADAEPV